MGSLRLGGIVAALVATLCLWPPSQPRAAVQRFIAEEYAFWAPLAKAVSLKVQ
jgi:hypothetical protein